jgi:hypothetical protein
LKPKDYVVPLICTIFFIALGVALGVAVSARPAPTKVQTIYVRNLSHYVTDAEVANDIPAFQTAIDKDFTPAWNVGAKLVFIKQKKAPRGAVTMTLFDKADVKGALAYHEVTDGTQGSKVFVGTSEYYHFAWTVGFTHELWEMLVNPTLVRTEQNPTTYRVWYGEVADPVESDKDGYNLPGANGKNVRISDFVTEKWFGAEVNGSYDFMNHIQVAGQVDRGGYAQWFDATGWHIIEKFIHGPDQLTKNSL